jgi:phage gp29-like protein
VKESGVLIDVHGNPLKPKSKDLQKEEAAPSVGSNRSSVFSSVISGLTPSKLSGILNDAVESDPAEFFALAEEMEERDLHYHSVLGTRKRAVTKLEIAIEPVDDSPEEIEIAELVRLVVETPEFDEMREDMLDAFGKGISVIEQIWDTSGDKWIPRQWKWRDPRFFDFDEKTRSELMLKEGQDLKPLTPGKFICHKAKVKSGLPIRGGLARLCALAFMMKNYTLKDWIQFCEIFGMPLRLGRYDASASEDDKRRLLRAVLSIAGDAGAIIPKGMDIEFINATSGRGEAVFGKLADYLDKQVSKAVLGQTMTTDDGSSQAQAKVHDDVRDDIRDADKRRAEATMQRDVVNQVVAINYGVRERYPKLTLIVTEVEDTEALANALSALVPLGLRVKQQQVREKFGLEEPEDGDELLVTSSSAENPSEKPPEKQANKKALNSSDDPIEEIDEITEEELAKWEETFAPLLAPVLDAADKADDFEAFLEKVDEIFADAEDGELIISMAKAMAKARINGLANG